MRLRPRALIIVAALLLALGFQAAVLAQTPPCGSATAPQCDGACYFREACEELGSFGICFCLARSEPCGLVGSPPECWGECPEGTACVDASGICECQIVTATPAGPTATPTITVLPSGPTPTITPTPTATPACAAVPVGGCRTPSVGQKAFLMLKDKAPDDAKDLLQWKWIKGSSTAKADFGTPLTSTSYQLCIYNGAPIRILDATIPAGGVCGASNPKPCWKDKTHGFDYKDKDLTPDGIEQLKLKEGASGKAQIILKGKGLLLDDPAIPVTLPVTVQLRNNTSSICWEAVYSTPLKNTAGPPGQFKAKAN